MCTVSNWSIILNILSLIALLVLIFVAIPLRFSRKKSRGARWLTLKKVSP